MVQQKNSKVGVKKRSRLGCNACKKLKTKCDELKPSCSRCQRRGIPCVYSFEMVFQNQALVETKKQLRIKDVELVQYEEAKQQRLKLMESESNIINKNLKLVKFDDFKEEINAISDNIVLQELKDVTTESDRRKTNGLLHENEHGENKETYQMSFYIPKSEIPILPLPTHLLEHPYYKDALKFFTHFTAHFIVASPPQLYKNNPLQNLVPQYAIENECLLDLLIAYSLTHRAMVLSDENFSPHLAELLVSRGILNLVSHINNTEVSIKTEVICLTTIFMCTQKIFSGEDVHKYKEIIDLCRTSFRRFVEHDKDITKLENGKYLISEEKNPFTHFLLCWIGYLEIIGMMMAISSKDFKMPYRPNPVFENYQMKTKSKIDLFLGMDIKFLVIFDKLIPILNMLEERDKNKGNDKEDSIPTSILALAIEWEHELIDAYNEFKTSSNDPNDPTVNDPILNASNEAFFYGGLLHLYRRVYKVPRGNLTVQKLVQKIYEIFKNEIESASNAENCAILPLFVAACESITEEHRRFFYDRFQIQFLGGNFPTGDVLEILTDTWNTGDSWIESVKRVRKEKGFFLI